MPIVRKIPPPADEAPPAALVQATESALSAPLQACVARVIAADVAGGEALLEKSAAILLAREKAARGEWGRFLAAIALHERAAQRHIAIAERAASDVRFCEAVRSGWLSFSVAAITAQADETLLDQLLTQETPPTRKQLEEKPDTGVGFLDPDLPDGWQITSRPGWNNETTWYRAMGPDGQKTGEHKTADGVAASARALADKDAAKTEATANDPRTAVVRKEIAAAPWACEVCGQPQTGMKRPNPPICTGCAMKQIDFGHPAARLPPLDASLTQRLAATGAALGHARRESDGQITYEIIAPRGSAGLSSYQATEAEIPNLIAKWESPHCEHCGEAATDKRSIGGILAWRCDGCAAADEQLEQERAAPASLQDWNAVARLTYKLGATRDIGVAWDVWKQIGRLLAAGLPRALASAGLGLIENAIVQVQTEGVEDLSIAIADLNECQEGTEGEHWVRVGWALLDVEPDDRSVPTLESEGIV